MRGLLPLLLLCAPTMAQATDTQRTYDGSRGELAVDAPRLEEAEVRIDGDLSDPEWERAARLTGFTQLAPAEGAAASERTEVLVFYTPTHLYVGVRAFVRDPSRIRATLAERDGIGRDDHVQIFLDTFDDRRRAYVLAVNPFGIQQDGVFSENGGGGRRGSQVDLAPDFIFQSRGRLTGDGYAVEMRIPLKSLKFRGTGEQRWGINAVRSIAATGAEESWAPISRGTPSRLAQSGTLGGVRGLRPGRLFEANPTLTARRVGQVREGGFRRESPDAEVGANLKYGVTPNLTLDATVNPDFSQVESDAEQITVNERFAISLPEKRPFFLEGADLFSTPEPLVYTRRIVDPVAGVRLTGKVGALNLGYVGAVDESPLASPGRYTPAAARAVFNVLRLQRDVGAGSTVGAVLTSREEGDAFNRVAGVDARIRFGGVYSWQLQAAESWTRSWRSDPAGRDTAVGGGIRVPVALHDRAGHLALAALDRTGRSWGFRLQLRDVPEGFRTQSGFVRRTGVSELFGVNRLTYRGAAGALLESANVWTSTDRVYPGRTLWEGGSAVEGSSAVRTSLSLRGNHRIEAGYARRFFTLDPSSYARYGLPGADGARETGDVLVAPGARMRGLDGVSVELGSSYFKAVSARAQVEWRQTPIFAEGTPGEEWLVEGGAELRPTEALRLDASLRRSEIRRARDGSRYSVALVPRLKAEYQLTRAIALRLVGQYAVEEVDLLRTPDGRPYLADGEPFRVRRGSWMEALEAQTNPLRLDALFSYRPSPGTVVFLGYGREVSDERSFRFGSLAPRSDGVFLKMSYLLRN